MCYAERNLSDAAISEFIGKATQDDLVALVHEALSGLVGPTAAYDAITSWAKAEGETEELIAQLEGS